MSLNPTKVSFVFLLVILYLHWSVLVGYRNGFEWGYIYTKVFVSQSQYNQFGKAKAVRYTTVFLSTIVVYSFLSNNHSVRFFRIQYDFHSNTYEFVNFMNYSLVLAIT